MKQDSQLDFFSASRRRRRPQCFRVYVTGSESESQPHKGNRAECFPSGRHFFDSRFVIQPSDNNSGLRNRSLAAS